ncbi:MAG: HAD-IG family 5'-nucleotidase [Proteobacteria bacterium]|nr:HAD-IG family 5'-nucleotidase [Pseudomonadota bacterium]
MKLLHGSVNGPIDRSLTQKIQTQAKKLLAEGIPGAHAANERPLAQVERARQVFVNRNLRMSTIELIGFDMDYTLAIYHQRRIEQLSFELSLQKLVNNYGYPPEILKIPYDAHFAIRGLCMDKAHGNLVKMDRFGHVGRVMHGRMPLDSKEYKRLYRDERIRPFNPAYSWIDTLFSLPEACMFADIIEMLERQKQPVDYAKLCSNIREAIDSIHRDGSLKEIIFQNMEHYIYKDKELGPTLHKLRSGGKKLFLLTNSLHGYTQAVMSYLLDNAIPEYPSWKNYFDFIITDACKPLFFSNNAPFEEILPENPSLETTSSLERGKIYQHGNLLDFERITKIGGDAVLYVGDHIYGDILKSKQASLWRTCMVVQELEDEMSYLESRAEDILTLSKLEQLRKNLDEEISSLRTTFNLFERRLEKEMLTPALLQSHKTLRASLEILRQRFRETNDLSRQLALEIDRGFNAYWGLVFKEGNETSRFGEQVEQYACIYTSRVSNLFFYSPMQYFRSSRDFMAHEKDSLFTWKKTEDGTEKPY